MRTRVRPDPLHIVEAGYSWYPDEKSWVEAIVRAASPYDIGGGLVACTVRVTAATAIEARCETGEAVDKFFPVLERAIQSCSPALARQIFAPTEFAGNAAHRLSRIARASRRTEAVFVESLRAQIPALWALVCGDPRFRSLMICFARSADSARGASEPFPHVDARSLGLVGAHIAAALRLRSLVPPSPNDAETEAVLTPAGAVLHARRAASSPDARGSLVEAVHASETARGRMRHASAGEALELWTALVRGRWTIVDCNERDGKRLLLARKNPLAGLDLLELTSAEREVTWLAAQGHSYKYIAYELGIPLSTVGGRLRRAMRKLRVGSRAELLRKLGTTEREK